MSDPVAWFRWFTKKTSFLSVPYCSLCGLVSPLRDSYQIFHLKATNAAGMPMTAVDDPLESDVGPTLLNGDLRIMLDDQRFSPLIVQGQSSAS